MSKAQAEIPPTPDLSSPSRFINRELSWLAFNERVLDEARNPAHPILERLRFLSISASNLDEFYMVRVAGLKGQVDAGVSSTSPDGLTPAQQLEAIQQRAGRLMAAQQAEWRALREQLRGVEISVLDPGELTPRETRWLGDFFSEQIFPVLTPLAVDPAPPLPPSFRTGGTEPGPHHGGPRGRAAHDPPSSPPQPYLPLSSGSPGRKARFPPAWEHVGGMELHLDRLFPGPEGVPEVGCFRVIRARTWSWRRRAEDLVAEFESTPEAPAVGGNVIHLRASSGMSGDMRDFLTEELGVDVDEPFRGRPPPGGEKFLPPAGYGEHVIAHRGRPRPELPSPPTTGRFPRRGSGTYGGDCFAAIRQRDIVVHHPTRAFDVVVAVSPAGGGGPCRWWPSKQTLYRTRRGSPQS